MLDIKEKILETKIKEITISGKLYVLFLKFLKTKTITPQKSRLLNFINTHKNVTRKELYAEFDMDPGLLSFHLNGNLNSEGLVKLEMISEIKDKNIHKFNITPLGKLILELTNE